MHLDANQPLRVGLIGFGLAGQVFHAPTIRAVAGLDLACIVERSGSLAQQKYPAIRVVRTVEELLADDSIRVCVVATPNTSHFEIAQRCLLAGRDVVVDKPFTITSAEAIGLIELAARQERLLSVFQSRRWDGDFLTLRKLLDSGALGRLVEYESRYDRFRPQLKPGNFWREGAAPGGGMLYDLGPHMIDQALVLFGSPEGVTAELLLQRDSAKVDDAFDVRLHYPGLSVTLRCRMLACAPGPRYVLNGTRGSFVKYGMDPQEEKLRLTNAIAADGWGEDPQDQWGTLTSCDGENASSRKVKTERGDYRAFYANIRDAITHNAPLAVTPEQAFRVIRAIELARQSSQEKRTVPWNESLPIS
jgi:scyllo-inositol 2-dehydrogenase (NADP+)